MITDRTLGAAIALLLINAALLAVPLAFFINYLYRKKLIKGMGYASKTMRTDDTTAPATSAQTPLFTMLKSDELHYTENRSFYKLKELLGLNWIVYIISFGVAAWAMARIFAGISGLSLSTPRLIFLILIFTWPLVLASMVTIASSRMQRLGFFIAYVLLNAGITLYIYETASDKTVSFLRQFSPIVMYNLMPTLLVMLLLMRSIRGSSFTVTAITIVAFFITTLILQYFTTGNHLQLLADWMHITGGGQAALAALMLVVLLFSFVAGFLVVRSARFFYNRKLITDQTFMIDAILIIHLAFYSVFLESTDPMAVYYGMVPFLFFKITSLFLFFLLRKLYKAPPMKRLLLLRVFALEAKSRNLLEHITKHWRFYGPVQMISGPDLATSTIDPHEVVTFLSGKMDAAFCDDEKTIEAKTQRADTTRDFDATYRIHEFFCRYNTWKHVLAALVNTSEVVLMDLRSFSKNFKGCQYEINQLVNRMPLNRVVFLVNADTDMTFTESCFNEAFARMDAGSPNAHDEPEVRFVDYTRERYADTLLMLNMMCRIADGEM